MCFFRKKKTEKEKVVADIDLIKANMQTMNVLLVYGQEVEDIGTNLKRIQETLRYMNPSDDPKVQHLDEKIGNKLGDLKIYLNKCHQKQNYEGWQDEIRELDILLAERDAKVI